MIYLQKHWWKFLIIFVVDIIILFPFVWQTSYVVLLPGDIEPIEELIVIENAYEQSGTINSTFVISFRKSTIFQKFLCEHLSEATVYNEIYQGTAGLSNVDYTMQGKIMHDVSVSASLISAYTKANAPIEYHFGGIYIFDVTDYLETFKIGDIIVGSSFEDCLNNLDAVKTNPNIGIQIIRNNLTQTIYPVVNEETNSFGIYLPNNGDDYNYKYYQIDSSTPSFNIKPTLTSGPSGGLLQSLSIFNHLTPHDYTNGLTIAGTGTIDILGNVGAIGGVSQKIYTANYNDVDVYFIPSVNYAEAKLTYDKLNNPKMDLVSVKTLDEAIAYLEGLND